MKSGSDEIVARFDSYVKAAMRYSLCDIRKIRDKQEANERIFTFEDVLDFVNDDFYKINENYITILGFDLMIKNDLLYESLRQLEENHRNIIYLSICKEWSDQKIGNYMNLSRQKVQRIKSKVLEVLRNNMMGDEANDK